MKSFLSIAAVVLAVGLSTAVMEAEAAKRMGSGKSVGMQRQATPDKASPAPTAATPAAATPAATAPAAGAATGTAAASGRSWMAPVAGLAAGLGLAALASHFGFGEALATMVMMGLLAFAVMAAVGYFLRRRMATQTQVPPAPLGMQYARVDSGLPADARQRPLQDGPAWKVSLPAGGREAGAGASALIGTQLGGSRGDSAHADFDRAGFERNAVEQFIRLQAAHDAGDLDTIRSFTTAELFDELRRDMAARDGQVQHTEVVRVQADVTVVEEDADGYRVTVRFTGELRDGYGPEESFDEAWHLTRPRQGNDGWLLAGIQQRG